MDEGSAPDPLIGRNVAGKFVIEKLLGAGAMGAVYRARQTALDKDVALKVLRTELATDPTFALRFADEAKAASRLDHPNSIRVFDFGEEPDGLLYIAMEYAEGRDLFSVIDEDPRLPPATIIDILSQVLAALIVAHDLGVLHRDLKPENILVLQGRGADGLPADIVKVCDFGIAKILAEPKLERTPSGRRKHSTQGAVVGTPAYMSPEQATGSEVDARSDLYSVGVVLYVMLTGREPFEADSAVGIALKHATLPPPPPSEHVPAVDARLEAICMRALQKAPSRRYQNAHEFRNALQGAAEAIQRGVPAQRRLASRPPPAMPPPPVDEVAGMAETVRDPRQHVHDSQAQAPKSRARIALALGAAVVLIGAAGTLFYVRNVRQHESVVANRASVLESGPLPVFVESAAPFKSSSIPSSRRMSTSATPATPPPDPRTGRPRPEPATIAVAIPVVTPPPPTPPPPDPTPPPPPVATTVAQVAVPPPPPPPPPFDVTTARVVMGQPTNMAGGLNATNVLRTLAPTSASMTACYRAALPRMAAPFEGDARLHIETDGSGLITDARVGGVGAASASCIAAAVQGRMIPAVDTGTASADIPLVFKSR